MDLVEKVDQTLRCVLNGRLSVEVDDTLLQKFLSSLDGTDSSHDSSSHFEGMVKRSQVLSYIGDTLCSEDRTSCALSFALQLLSVIAKQKIFDIFHPDHAELRKSLLYTLDPNGDKGEISSSVRVAMLTCLATLAETNDGYAWIVQNDLMETGWRNLCHSSIFVQRASEKFLTSVLMRELTSCSGQSRTSSRVLQVLEINEEQGRKGMFVGCVRILSRSLLSLPSLQSLNQNLGQTVFAAFQSYPSEDQTADELNRIAVLFCKEGSCLSILEQLTSCGRFASALKFSANYLLSNVSKEEVPVDELLNVLKSPLVSLSGQKLSDSLPQEVARRLPDMSTDSSGCHRLLSSSLTQLARVLALLDQPTLVEMMRSSAELLSACLAGKKLALPPQARNKNVTALLDFQKKVLTRGVKMDLETAIHIVNIHVALLQDLSLSSATFQATCRVVHALAPCLCPCSSLHGLCGWTSSAADSLGQCLSRRLLDRHWEVVDSILELCAFLLTSDSVCESKCAWFLGHSLHTLIWDMLANEDSEGYVRAACVRALVAITLHPTCWQRLREIRCLTSKTVGEMLCSLLMHDPEAFVQRDAARGVQQLLKSSFLSEDCRQVWQTLLQVMMSSLDWEVKVTILECCRTYLDHVLSRLDQKCSVDKICATFDSLFCDGCLEALACGLADCDRPVRLLAAQTVQEIRRQTENLDCLNAFLVAMKEFKVERCETDDVTNSVEAKTDFSVDERQRVLDMVLDTNMRDRITAVIVPCAQPNVEHCSRLQSKFEYWQEAVAFLWQSDLDSVIRESEMSTDVYQDNLSALLDDILAAVEGESEGEDYQAIDCY